MYLKKGVWTYSGILTHVFYLRDQLSSFDSTTRNVFPSVRELWSMLPFARIFLVSLIFYWLMCEVFFAHCKNIFSPFDI